MHIVFVRGIAGPVAGWRVDLYHHQALAREARRHDAVDLAGGVVAAADLDLHIGRRHPSGLSRRALRSGSVLFPSLHPGHGELAGCLRGHSQVGVQRQIERVGQAGEHIRTLADPLPAAAVRVHVYHAAQQHQHQLMAAGLKGPGLAGRQPAHLKMDRLPAGQLRRHLHDHIRVSRVARVDGEIVSGVLAHEGKSLMANGA
jgi:hypothetical protein